MLVADLWAGHTYCRLVAGGQYRRFAIRDGSAEGLGLVAAAWLYVSCRKARSGTTSGPAMVRKVSALLKSWRYTFMAYLRALINPAYALGRVRHYGFGRVVIDQAKAYPALLPATFKALRAAKIAMDPFGYVRRRRIAANMAARSQYRNFFSPIEGFVAAPPAVRGVDEIIPVARELYADFLSTYPMGTLDGTSFSYLLYDHSKSREHHKSIDIRANAAFQELASYRPFLEIASCYLGEFPILGGGPIFR